MMLYMGEIAALGTALAWSVSAINFTSASRRIGSLTVNRYRILLGSIFLITLHFILLNRFFPSPTDRQLVLLVTSGVIGLVLGDSFLFQSYIDIGPRLTLLIFNIHPFITAILASAFLNEKLKGLVWIGMFITIGGTIWVVNEKNRGKKEISHRHYVRGILFAVLAAMGQSVGFVMSKPALTGEDGLPPLSATVIRVMSAAIVFWVVGLLWGKLRGIKSDLKNGVAMQNVVVGSFFGPFIGIWLSLVALKYAPAGIAATLMATLPVAILPMVIIVYKEKVSWRALIGAIIAVIGVLILFNV